MENDEYYDYFSIDTLFWGALIFLALFLSRFLAWKGIEWLRKRRKVDDAAAKGGHHKDPPITRAVMNQREQEEIFSAARKARKEMQRLRTAREQAQRTQSDS